MIRKLKPKKCRNCGVEFKPYNPLQVVCEIACALEYNRKQKVEAKVKQFKDNLKDHAFRIKTLQIVFNSYIRERDKDQPCICCGKPLGKVFHAGHLWSVGAYPGVRFNEDNCHGQRTECNLYRHGNAAEYAIRLPQRIGQERFNELFRIKEKSVKLSIPEIQEKITYYTQKIKNLKSI